MTPPPDHPGCLFPGTCIHNETDHQQQECITHEMVRWIVEEVLCFSDDLPTTMKLDPKDTPPDWETNWENEQWNVDTLHLTDDEQRFLDELKSEVLPPHMPVWDWNLPFAEKIIVMMRRYSENVAGEATASKKGTKP